MYRATSSGTQGTSNFCLFHTRNCAASPVLTASAICSPDAFSCATREKMRSPPARSTRTRMLLFEGLTDFFRQLEVGRRVPSKLAFFRRRSDQCRCDAFSWWRCRTQRRRIDKRQCGCGLENLTARKATAHEEKCLRVPAI